MMLSEYGQPTNYGPKIRSRYASSHLNQQETLSNDYRLSQMIKKKKIFTQINTHRATSTENRSELSEKQGVFGSKNSVNLELQSFGNHLKTFDGGLKDIHQVMEFASKHQNSQLLSHAQSQANYPKLGR